MLNFYNKLNISRYKNQDFLYDFYNPEYNNKSINYLCITNAYIDLYESHNNFIFDITNFLYDKYIIYFNSSIEKKLKEIEHGKFEKLNSVNISENLEKIKDIKLLKNNWNSYDAKPISRNLCDKVVNLIKNIIVQPKIFPTANNSILFEYYDRRNLRKYLGFEIFEDNIEVFEVFDNGDINEFNIDFCIEYVNNFIRKFYGIK